MSEAGRPIRRGFVGGREGELSNVCTHFGRKSSRRSVYTYPLARRACYICMKAHLKSVHPNLQGHKRYQIKISVDFVLTPERR